MAARNEPGCLSSGRKGQAGILGKDRSYTGRGGEEAAGDRRQQEMVEPSISVEGYSAILMEAQSNPAIAKKVQAELQKAAPAQQ